MKVKLLSVSPGAYFTFSIWLRSSSPGVGFCPPA